MKTWLDFYILMITQYTYSRPTDNVSDVKHRDETIQSHLMYGRLSLFGVARMPIFFDILPIVMFSFHVTRY